MNNAMRQFEERHMATKLDLLVWSNKMDLLAVSNAKGEVCLHRLSWQRVWCLSPPTESALVNGIAWRPDGKIIAISYTINVLLLVNVENKDIVHRTRVADDYETEMGIKVWYMGWLEERGIVQAAPPQAVNIFLPKLEPISRTLSEETGEAFEDMKKVTDQKDLNFLVVVLSTGVVHLSVFGLFHCGFLSLPIGTDSVFAVEMSSDLEELFVCLGKRDNTVDLVVYDVSVLATYAREIHTLSLIHGQVCSLCDYLQRTMEGISEAYENILLAEMESKLSDCACIRGHNSVSADLLELLVFGFSSPVLDDCLFRDLSDKVLKKLAHSVELSHSNIQKLIYKNMMAVTEKMSFHLSNLSAMTRVPQRFTTLGLDNDLITECFNENGAFIVKGSEVLVVIDDLLIKYKALFKWLNHVLTRLTDDRIQDTTMPGISDRETAFIAEFLNNLEAPREEEDPLKKKNCYLDYLGQYLADAELIHPLPIAQKKWEQFVQENRCIKNNRSMIPRYPKFSLVQQHARLKETLKNAFARTQETITGQMKVKRGWRVCRREPSAKPKGSLHHSDRRLTLCFLPTVKSPTFIYWSLVKGPTSQPVSSTVYFKSPGLPDGISKIIDLQIYTKDVLSILCEEEKSPDERKSLFGQLPLREIHTSTSFDANDGRLLRPIENMTVSKLAVSGSRKVAVILSENMHKVRTYEMEVDEDDQEEEEMDGSRENETLS